VGNIDETNGQMSNSDRTELARLAADAFCQKTCKGTPFGKLIQEDKNNAISDLISGLLHLALAEGVDTDEAIGRAVCRFSNEIAQEIKNQIQ
jgi:hypothetical protein